MPLAETAELAVRLTLKDGLSAGISGSIRSLDRLNAATSNTQRALGRTWSNIERGVAIASAAALAGGVAVVRAAADFETAFAGVRKTVDEADLRAVGSSFEELSGQIRTLAKEIPVSASELARLGEAAGALGVKADAIDEFIKTTALLGVTTNLTAEQAAESLGVLGNVLGLTATDYERFASALVALGNAGASTESDIVAIAERAGAAGKLIGVNTPAILGFASAVASLGIEAEAGGTALQKFFIDAAKQVAGAGDELDTLARTAGTTAKEFARAFDQDAGAALTRFLTGLGKLPQAQQLRILEDLGFNDARITRTLLGLANNTALLTGQLDLSAEAFQKNTALSIEAAERFKTFDSQVTILKNNIQDAAITIGTKLLPKLIPLVQQFTALIQRPETQRAIEAFGTDLANGFERFATEIGRVDFSGLISGLKLTADIAKQAIDIFRSLPEPIQQALVAGFAVNKVTGGLVTGIGKDLVALFNQQFLGRGANPANPLFVFNVNPAGGGLPGVVPAAGAGGIAGFLARALPIVGGFMLVKLAADQVSEISRGVTGTPSLDELVDRIPADSDLRKPIWERQGFKWPWEATSSVPVLRGDRVPYNPSIGPGGSQRPFVPYDPNLGPGMASPLSEAAEKQKEAAVKLLEAASAHEQLAAQFESGALGQFRGSAQSAIELFDKRIAYLRGAQGAFRSDEDPKGQQFDAVVSRDIAALKALMGGATSEQQTQLQSQIDILIAIRDKETFPPTAKMASDAVKSAVSTVASAVERVQGAIRNLPKPEVNVYPTISAVLSVDITNVQQRWTTTTRYTSRATPA